MPAPIDTLTLDDHDELVAFINRAFGKTGDGTFEHITPRLIRPEMMPCYHAIRENERIVASLGVFPIEWIVGEHTLRIAGIGAVACDPECRGQGLMSKLMSAVTAHIEADGYHLSVLGGQRQRYAYFGWERCGSQVQFQLTEANLRHAMTDVPVLRVEPFDLSDDGLVQAARALYDRQVARANRPAEDFAAYLNHWNALPFAAFDQAGEFAGYAVTNRNVTVANELFGDTPEHACAIASHLVREAAKQESSLRVVTAPVADPIFRRLLDVNEYWTLTPSGNWQVFDWKTTLEALLSFRHAQSPLVPGEATIAIDGREPTQLRLRVTAEGASVAQSSDATVSPMKADAALRLLFGPLPPHLSMPDLPAALSILSAWCPLPLYLPHQDLV